MSTTLIVVLLVVIFIMRKGGESVPDEVPLPHQKKNRRPLTFQQAASVLSVIRQQFGSKTTLDVVLDPGRSDGHHILMTKIPMSGVPKDFSFSVRSEGVELRVQPTE